MAKRRHDAREAEQEEQPVAEQSPPADTDSAVEPAAAGGLTHEAMGQLRQLGELHEQNVLTDEEFEREKTKLLG